MNLNLILMVALNPSSISKVYVLAKHTRKTFKIVHQDITLLEMVHSDVCDSNKQP